MIRITRSRDAFRRRFARAGVAVSSFMLAFSCIVAFGTVPHAAALDPLGAVQFKSGDGLTSITSGGSATVFQMSPPVGAACPGSGTDGYRWQTFLVSAAVDAGALTYTGAGPAAVGTSFVSPMYDGAQNTVTNGNPSASPVGQITAIPTFTFSPLVPPFDPPPGEYKVGIACSLAGATVSFWVAQITITADAADTPAGFTWAVSSVVTPTSTTTTTTTIPQGGGSSTTTTVRPTTTTSTSTTSTTSTSTTVARAAAAVPTSGSSSGLVSTGSSPLPIVVWGVLLLIFGRMAMLVGRRTRVVADKR